MARARVTEHARAQRQFDDHSSMGLFKFNE